MRPPLSRGHGTRPALPRGGVRRGRLRAMATARPTARARPTAMRSRTRSTCGTASTGAASASALLEELIRALRGPRLPADDRGDRRQRATRPRSACTPPAGSCASARCARSASSSAAGWTASSCSDRSARATLRPHRKNQLALHLARRPSASTPRPPFRAATSATRAASACPRRTSGRAARMLCANSFGSRRAKSPQNTPTTRAPLSSARLSGSLGISPAAKPTTRSRPRQASERNAGSVYGAADRVVDHVDAAAIGERLDALAQILGGVVDGVVGAVAAAHGELVVARCAGDDARAERLADLDRRQADAARGAEHQQRLARLERAAVAQRVVRRPVGQQERRAGRRNPCLAEAAAGGAPRSSLPRRTRRRW